MSNSEILLVMTIVSLITKSIPSAGEVEKAYGNAIKELERRERGPLPAR